MPHQEKNLQEVLETLIELGLTTNQAKVLFALQKFNYASVRDIAREANLHRQELYSVLSELQSIGLVEQIIGRPVMYRADTLSNSLNILLNRKMKLMCDIKEKVNNLIQEANKKFDLSKERTKEKRFFTLVTGAERFRKVAVGFSINALTVDVALNFDLAWVRLGSILPENFEYPKGAKIRLVTCIQPILPSKIYYWYRNVEEVKREVRFLPMKFPANFGIYDKEVANFTILSNSADQKNKKPNVSSLVSNHPAFVEMLQHYFNVLWDEAQPYSKT